MNKLAKLLIPACLLLLAFITWFYSDNYYEKLLALNLIGKIFMVIATIFLFRGFFLFKRYGKPIEIPFLGYLVLSVIVLVAFFLPNIIPKDPRITEDVIRTFVNGYTYVQAIPTFLYTVVFLRIAVLVGTNE